MIARFTHPKRLLAATGLLALGLLAPASASAGNPCFHGFEMPPASVGTDTQIKLMPCAFAPTVTQVPVGAEVTFFNGPDFAHLITGANQAWGSPETEIKPNEEIAYTFEEAGLYPYACILHPGMSGVIVVGDVTDALAAGGTGSVTGGPADPAPPVATTAPDPDLAADVLDAEAVAVQSIAQASTTESAQLSVEWIVAGVATLFLVAVAGVWLALRRRTNKDVRVPTGDVAPAR